MTQQYKTTAGGILEQNAQQKQIEFVARKEFENMVNSLPKGLKIRFEMDVEFSRMGIQTLSFWKVKGRSKTMIEQTPHLDQFVTALSIVKKVLI